MAADLPAEHLQRALSDLTLTPESGQGLPTDTPALRWRTRLHQTTACTPCMTRRGIRPPVLTHRPTAPDLICPQHAIWLDGRQIHLKPLPEVLTAFRAYRRICRRHGTDHAELRNSETIVTHWFNQSRITTLNARWHNRLRTIDSTPPNAADSARRIVTIPEIVTVASHLLLARITAHPGDYDFLKTIATSIGLRGPWEFHPQDPLRLCLVDRLIFAGKNPPRRARPLTGWRTLAPCAR